MTTLTFALACNGSSGQGTESDSGSISGTATATNSTGSTGGGTDTGGADHEICDRYIACVAATLPAGLPAAQEGFGPNATCWTLSQMEIDICLMTCETGLNQGHSSFPDAVECYLCQDDSECNTAAGELCYKGACTLGPCGDGIVQANELCDGADDCSDDCQGGAKCSPLTDVGCDEGEVCEIAVHSGIIDPFCYPGPRDCSGKPGETCPGGTFCNYDDMDDWIGCLPYCDLNAPMPCPDGLTCVPYGDGSEFTFDKYDALSYLGECLPP